MLFKPQNPMLDNAQYGKGRLKYLLSKKDLTEKGLDEAIEIFNYRHKNDTTSVDFTLYGAMVYLRAGEYERFLSMLVRRMEMGPIQREWNYIMGK